MPLKPLSADQISLALGTNKAQPSKSPQPRLYNSYDTRLDSDIEFFLDPANRPPKHTTEGTWPPQTDAGIWAHRLRCTRLLGGSETTLAEDLSLFLSCHSATRSAVVRYEAFRCIDTLCMSEEFRKLIAPDLLANCIAVINEHNNNEHGEPDVKN